MRAFLLKVNGNTRCPNGVSVPATLYDWRSREFSSKRTKGQASVFAGGAAGPEPAVGDKVYIWVNEDSGGRGLTAVATIKAVSTSAEQHDFEVTELSFLKNMISMDRAVAAAPKAEIVIEIKRYRPERTWALADLDVNVIDGLIANAGGLKPDATTHPLQDALLAEKSAVETALQDRKTALTKIRPGQSSFRNAALERHNRRCVFTKTKVEEVLEAAHVIPHTGAPEFECPDNSLLLRRDIHALFDLLLLSIDPETNQILVSSDLQSTMYGKLSKRTVDHKLARPALDFHAQRFFEFSTS